MNVSKSVLIEASLLGAALKEMVKTVERRNTIPILSNVLIRTGPSTLTLVATDLDVELRQQLDLVDPGSNDSFTICVDAHTFADIIRKLAKGAQARLTLEDGKMLITAGRSKFKLHTLPADDFPEIGVYEWAASFEMDKANLISLISATAFAMSTETTRYYLNGIYVHFTDGQMFGAATDGSRLARFHCEEPEGACEAPGSIVSRKTVGLLDALLEEHGTAVGVDVSRGKIRFKLGAVELTSKLIDGTFPDYTRVIPTMNNKALWFDPKQLSEAVDRIATISREKTKIVRFDLARDLLTLSMASPEAGSATEDLPCEYDAEPMSIGLNSRFVLDVCAQLTGDHVQVLFASPEAPTLWRDGDESRRLYVLMPARV